MSGYFLAAISRRHEPHGFSFVPTSLSMPPIHGQPYPHRQGVGNMRDPITRITRDMNDPIKGWPVSATQSRMALSEALLSSAVPPHQYVMSCSTQQACHSESGHNVQPSVRNSRSGTNCSPPRRSEQRNFASFCGSSEKRALGSSADTLAHPAQTKAITIAEIVSDVDCNVIFAVRGVRNVSRILRRLSHDD